MKPSTTSKIRILIVEDQPIVRSGLIAMLSKKADFEVVGEAADGKEAAALARELRPDVILMDLVMPEYDGIQAIREIKRDNPEARVLVLSGFSEDERIIEAMRSGAQGYILKHNWPEDLVTAIRQAYAGETPINSAVARILVQSLIGQPGEAGLRQILTPRELDVLRLVGMGINNQEIAERLGISERTASTHISNMLDKLGLETRTQLALFAVRNGLSPLHPDE